jgi:hypothetical protein
MSKKITPELRRGIGQVTGQFHPHVGVRADREQANGTLPLGANQEA